MLLTRKEASEYLRLKPITLAQWALNRRGPIYYKVGGKILYKQQELEEWLKAQQRPPLR
jgi:excisionase family DNA binding protein